ncbi:MAG: zf-HC2 domain-containing protein [Pyrinomonadaceae bacterium MAG19_C2-C3]|nr:zf-HC2 domain-containing protein [Pyrinomonadaceae bacterium MAG19_C2-C3]
MTHESSTDMNKHDSDSTLAKSACECSAQLVAYLYGEMPERDAARFTEHLALCATCTDEAVAFGRVRTQVTALKLAMPDVRVSHAEDFLDRLNVIASTMHASPNARGATNEVTHDVRHANDAPRSAWAAFRELLTLTPRSVKACAALTIIAVCMLAMLALINAEVQWRAGGDFAFRTGLTRDTTPDNITDNTATPATASITNPTLDPAVVERLVAERLEAELSRRTTREQIASNRDEVKNEIETLAPAAKSSTVEATLKPRTARTAAPRAKRNTSRRRNLDVQPDETDVPRLYDLLGVAE